MKEKTTFSKAQKRWLVREVQSGRMTLGEAKELVSSFSTDTASLIRSWQRRYGSELVLTLPVMTEKEKQKLESAQKRIGELEKMLEDAQMKNTALETMIDLTEDKLRISIRKKSGHKQ